MPFRAKSFRGRPSGGACPPCPPGVTQYGTVSELLAASIVPGLVVGYYEVVGEWITYWDGATFAPEFDVYADQRVQIGNNLPADDLQIKVIDFYQYPADLGTDLTHNNAAYASDLESGSAWSFV